MALKCSMCLRSCESLAALEIHLGLVHFNYKPFQCMQCQTAGRKHKFATEAAVKDHCKQEHTKEKFYYRVLVTPKTENDHVEIQRLLEECIHKSESCTKFLRSKSYNLFQDCDEPSSSTDGLIPELPTEVDEGPVTLLPAAEVPKKSVPVSTSPRGQKRKRIEKEDSKRVKRTPVDSLRLGMISKSRKQLANTLTTLMNQEIGDKDKEADVPSKEESQADSKIKCATCKEMVLNHPKDLCCHINTMHTKFAFYSCRICQMECHAGHFREIQHHFRIEHPGIPLSEENHTDNFNKFWPKINQKIGVYFPREQPHEQDQSSAQKIKPSVQPSRPGFGSRKSQPSAPSDGIGLAARRSSSHANVATGIDSKMRAKRCLMLNHFSDDCQRRIRKKDIHKSTLSCSVCHQMVKYNYDRVLLDHANKKHLHLKIFQCRVCGTGIRVGDFSTTAITRHVNAYHDGDESVVQSNQEKFRKQVEEKCIELFGKKY